MSPVFPPEFEVEIEKINLLGAGVGIFGNRPVAVFGTIPGDRVKAKPLRVSKKHSKAEAIEIINPSSNRLQPRDIHYPSTSPWQIMPYEFQLSQKRWAVKTLFKEKAHYDIKDVEIVPSELLWNYRTKMEYSFFKDFTGKIHIGFKKRFRWRDMYNASYSATAPEKMNAIVMEVVKKINESGIQLHDLKSLVLRYSFYEQKCIAGLFIKNKKSVRININHGDLTGFHIIYSDPLSPASNIDEVLYQNGEEYLTEKIHNNIFLYHWNGFFQQNIPTFEKLIKYVSSHLKNPKRIIDLYAGVGTIGIALSKNTEKIISIEHDARASALTKQNASRNNVSHISFITSTVESQDLEEIIVPSDTVIIDPSRAGLHPKVVDSFVKDGPSSLIYISCNPKTQAIDSKKLLSKYTVQEMKLFDLYPHTPHVESVLILKRK